MNTNQFRSFRGFASVLGVSLALLVFLSGAMFAQETWGSVRGAVTDPSGAAVPNARVEISGGGLPSPLVTTTDATGNYHFAQVPPATYALTVTLTGFQMVKKTSVPVILGRTTAVDFRMEVGSVTESVVVAADAVMVDTTSSASSTSVEKSFFDVLPRGRNFDSLIAVAPGARYEAKQGGYQIDGASGSENVFYINGMEVTNIQSGVLNRSGQIPFEFVQEVQIKSGGLEAQYGGAIGGAVNAVLRSGTNDFHGQVGLFLSTDATNARPRQDLRLNPNNDNIAEYFQYKRDGYSLINPVGQIGGPIVRNKIWFLVGYMPEFAKTNRDVTFTGGQTGSYERKERQDFFLGKIDWAATEKVRTQFSYMYNPNKVNGLLPTQQGTDAYSSPWSQLGNRTPSSNYTFQADWLVSNKLIISGRGGYNYRNYKDYGIPRGTYYYYVTSNRGLTDTAGNVLPIPPQYVASTGAFTANNRQTVLDEFTRFNLNLDATYTFNAAGQHTLKGGWQYNRLANKSNASTWPDGYMRLGWGRAYQGITVPGSYRGTYGYYIDRYFSTQGDVSSSNQGLFIQDTWRIGKTLTLNLGLRTEHEFVPSFRTDSGIPSRAIDFPWSQKFAPRVGFAWDPTGVGKWKIYGSWGMFYDVMKYEMPRGSFGGDK